MSVLPEVLVLDVNETLSDLDPLRERFARVGLPEHGLEAWFAATLRDGFALTAADSHAPSATSPPTPCVRCSPATGSVTSTRSTPS